MWEVLFNQSLEQVSVLAENLPIIPLAIFGSLVEEIISPIPSIFVALAIGAASVAQGKGLWLVIIYSLLEAGGKTIGSLFFYFLADKAEDLATGRFGRLFGLSHREIEQVGRQLEKKSFDDWALFASRVIPAFPSLPMNLFCGLIKYNFRKYLLYSAVGFWLRSLAIILPIYYGVLKAGAFVDFFVQFESYAFGPVLLVLVGLVVWLVVRNRQKAQREKKLPSSSNVEN